MTDVAHRQSEYISPEELALVRPDIVGFGTNSTPSLDTIAGMQSASLSKEMVKRLSTDVGEFGHRLHDEITSRPSIVYANNVRYRSFDVLKTIPEDYRDSENKVRTIGWLALMGGSQAADRMAVSLIFVPKVATNVLKHTHNGLYTGIAAGLAYGAWVGGVGEIFNQTLARGPKTVEKAKESFPGAVDVFTEGLPGIKSAEELKGEVYALPKQSLRKRITGKVGMHVRRSLSALQFGSTAYVGTAHTNGYTKKEASKVNLAVAADAGAGAFGIGWIGGTIIVEALGNGDVERAKHVMDIINNTRLWYGVAAGAIVLQFVLSRGEKAKRQKESIEPDEANEATLDIKASTTIQDAENGKNGTGLNELLSSRESI